MLGLETTHIMLFWFKAQVQILYFVAFHNCNCMTWVSNGIDFDAWLLFLLMINDFMKYSNSFAYGHGNGYYWCEHTCKQPATKNPYLPSLNLYCNIEASGRMLEVMLATWNVDERAFKVGDKLIPFTLYDVALILGLPVTGESIDCNKSYGVGLVETLLVTHFKTAWPAQTKLVTLLTKPSTKVPNRVRLYMTLVLIYFLFPTSNKKVSLNLLALLDDIPKLGSYAGGRQCMST